MLYSDLGELKSVLEIPPGDKSEDKQLLFWNEFASRMIEEVLNRPDLTYKSRTEYYDGTGTQYLTLRNRPVYTTPAIQVYEDDGGYFGSATGGFDATTSLLTYGTDYCLKIREEGQPSRSGILIRINDYWPMPPARERGLLTPFRGDGRGNIKVIYTGGYTVDTLPAPVRMAANLLVAKYRYVFPLGVELTSENYEDRSISVGAEAKNYLFSLVEPHLRPFRNWRW